jgi:beta-phosphoglucomutase
MIKGIIFDMDGVLVEAKEWHYVALNKALKLFGFEISRFDHLAVFDGLPTRRKLEILSVERGLPVQLHSFINEMKQAYTMEIVHTQCKPRFVHEYALSKLKAIDYKLGLASNSVKTTIEVMMQKANLEQYLDVKVSAEEVTKGKPDPEIYIKAMEHLGINPSECLIVEDNENGIQAARASGAHVMVVKEVDEVNIEKILNIIKKIDAEVSR